MSQGDCRDLVAAARAAVNAFDPSELKSLGLLPLNDLFYPAIYYPPGYPTRTAHPRSSFEELLSGFEWKGRDRTCLYVHIPQCPSRCTYCHWVVSLQNSPSDIDRYLDHLEKEMDLWKERLGGGQIRPSAVLIGGGTPTILSTSQMRRFMRALSSRFDLSHCRQFSVEAEPTTILGNDGLEKLRVMKDHGVHRISMGVQSFDDKVLRYMARPHNAQEAREAIRQIRRAGIESISIDLIYGFPGCTPENWFHTLEDALSKDIDAFQLYRLRIIPHGDKVGAVKGRHEKAPEAFPTLEDIYVMKALGKLVSRKHGFDENLRRIFSRSPRHISFYLRDYGCRIYDNLGIGISSWSNLGDRFFLNTGSSLKTYYAAIDEGRLPLDRGLIHTDEDRLRRPVVLPLKSYGVSKSRYREATGFDLDEIFGARIRRLKEHGLLEEDCDKIALTERGGFFADEVVMQFYETKFLPFAESDYSDGPLNPHRQAVQSVPSATQIVPTR